MKKNILKNSLLFLVYFLLFLPIIILIIYSFNSATFSVVWQGFTWHWYLQLLDDSAIWRAAGRSLKLALTSSVIATIAGTMIAIISYQYHFRTNQLSTATLLMMVVVPDILLATGLLMFFHIIGVPLGFFSMLIGHVALCLPFVALMLLTALKKMDSYLFHAAFDLGASRLFTIKKIVLPDIMPTLVASLLLCFTLSFDDVLLSYFISGPGYETLPLHFYSLIRVGVTPEINALSSLIVLVSVMVVVPAYMLVRGGGVDSI
jgi:spermidine/putrescine transport system permease protein